MPIAIEGTASGTLPAEAQSGRDASERLVAQIASWLDDAKAEEIVTIDLAGKSSMGDFMIIASGRTDRHVGAIADKLQKSMKEAEGARPRVEGTETCDWVLVDTGDVIVHLFRPEVREFYNLEKMWQAEHPGESTAH